jgi:preprotein translocase subunit SecA
MEDNLMRIFASDRIRGFMQALGMEHGEAIEHRMVTNAIEKAQRKVEGRNFDIRKQLLEYDDVSNDQRQVIYQQRNDLLEADSIGDMVSSIREDVVADLVSGFIPPQSLEEQWDIPGLEKSLEVELGLNLPVVKWLEDDKKLHEESLLQKITEEAQLAYKAKEERFGEVIREVEKQIMLQVLDTLWKEHLANMDHLRQGIGLRAFAQKNPKQEYKRESFELFQEMLGNLKHELIRVLATVQPISQEEMQAMEDRRRAEFERQQMQLQHEEANSLGGDSNESKESTVSTDKPFVRQGEKVGRNDACPCGSGKKFKQCHGKLA